MKPSERYINITVCEHCKYYMTKCNICKNYDEYVCIEIDRCRHFAMVGNCSGCGYDFGGIPITKADYLSEKPYVHKCGSYYTNGVYESNWRIKNVIFNDPATIVFWSDGTKTVVKAHEDDEYDPEKGLAMAIAKKAMGNKGRYYNELKKWLEKDEAELKKALDELLETIWKLSEKTEE